MTIKLIITQNSSKGYWSLLKGFLNNKKNTSNSFITDFKEKAELLKSFLAKQCSLIKNNSELTPA